MIIGKHSVFMLLIQLAISNRTCEGTDDNLADTDIVKVLKRIFRGEEETEVISRENDIFKTKIMENLLRQRRNVAEKEEEILKKKPSLKTKDLHQILNTTFNVNRGVTLTEKRNKFAPILLSEFQKIFPDAFIQESEEFKIIPWIPSNIIGILPGERRGKPDDQILVVGAHYDTIESPEVRGILDSASGVAVVMEIARLLKKSKWKLKYSVLFVGFDLQEVGLLGSKSFVEEYLIPKELEARGGSFKGAIVMDTLLSYNPVPFSQKISDDSYRFDKALSQRIEGNKRKGDFIVLNYRREMDHDLAEKLKYYWDRVENPQIPLLLSGINIQDLRSKQFTSITEFENGDHRSFWLASSDESVYKAVRINDGGFTRDGGKCMHTECGNIDFVTPNGLKLMKKTGDTVLATLLDLQEASL